MSAVSASAAEASTAPPWPASSPADKCGADVSTVDSPADPSTPPSSADEPDEQHDELSPSVDVEPTAERPAAAAAALTDSRTSWPYSRSTCEDPPLSLATILLAKGPHIHLLTQTNKFHSFKVSCTSRVVSVALATKIPLISSADDVIRQFHQPNESHRYTPRSTCAAPTKK